LWPDWPVVLDELPAGAERLDGDHDVWIVRLHDAAGTWIGIDHYHRHPTSGRWCGGCAMFDVPAITRYALRSVWRVESHDPLTVSPSLLCGLCGRHGFIRSGRWEET
jgi:hypothetical protein